MSYSPEDLEWIKRRARRYSDQSGYADAHAIDLAMSDLDRLRKQPYDNVRPIRPSPDRAADPGDDQ